VTPLEIDLVITSFWMGVTAQWMGQTNSGTAAGRYRNISGPNKSIWQHQLTCFYILRSFHFSVKPPFKYVYNDRICFPLVQMIRLTPIKPFYIPPPPHSRMAVIFVVFDMTAILKRGGEQ
jgi:hypothetical protein